MGDGQEDTLPRTAAELIEALRANPTVLAILSYGSGVGPDAADTDLCVVVSERPLGLESVHFWLESGPVDLNVRTLAELKAASVEPGFDEVLREGTVLYERDHGALRELPSIPQPEKDPASQAGMARVRHGFTHYMTKLDHHKNRDPLLCNVLLCGATHWLLHAYVSVRGRAYRGERAALQAVEQRDPDLLADLRVLSGSSVLEDRIEALRRLVERVLEPVGGPWRRGEVLCFASIGEDAPDLDRWTDFFKSLIASKRNGSYDDR